MCACDGGKVKMWNIMVNIYGLRKVQRVVVALLFAKQPMILQPYWKFNNFWGCSDGGHLLNKVLLRGRVFVYFI